MILIDTNVISEAMKPDPHPSVLTWLNDQAAETLYVSNVTMAEMLFGIENDHSNLGGSAGVLSLT